MPTDLQSILRMRKPSGRHVGAAMLLNLVNDYINAGIPHEPLFSQDKLSKMTSSFSSDTDLQIYANYADIITGAEHLFDYTEYCVQQVMHGFYRLNSVLSELSASLKLRSAAREAGIEGAQLEFILSALRSPSSILSDTDDREFLKISYDNLIYHGVRGMLAFDSFMDIISEVTGVPEVVSIKSRSEYVLQTITLLNNIVTGGFSDSENQALQSLFPAINIDSMLPDGDKIINLKKSLSSINRERCPALKRMKPLILSLL